MFWNKNKIVFTIHEDDIDVSVKIKDKKNLHNFIELINHINQGHLFGLTAIALAKSKFSGIEDLLIPPNGEDDGDEDVVPADQVLESIAVGN